MMLIQPLPSVEELPAVYTLGKTNAEINIDSASENASAVMSLAQQARRNINIYSQDLDSILYDNLGFVMALSNLALSDTRTVIRILVHDSISAVKSGHKILKLAQSMPGSVFIRNPSRLYQHLRCSFMVTDSLGYVYQNNAYHNNYDASVNFMSPRRATTLDDKFMEVWEQSSVDRNVRRLYM